MSRKLEGCKNYLHFFFVFPSIDFLLCAMEHIWKHVSNEQNQSQNQNEEESI
jgi:hypothetical protein